MGTEELGIMFATKRRALQRHDNYSIEMAARNLQQEMALRLVSRRVEMHLI
jgi:hypothetical protein